MNWNELGIVVLLVVVTIGVSVLVSLILVRKLLVNNKSTGTNGQRWIAQIKPNILMIAVLVAVICGGIVWLLFEALALMKMEKDVDFVTGALIGLLGNGLTALAALGNLISNEKEDSGAPSDRTPPPT